MREKSGFANHHMIIALVVFFLTGCAMVPESTQSRHFGDDGPLGRCADFFASLDQQISIARTFDTGAFRVTDYPYLRANRFLVSFRKEVTDKNAFAAWINQMQALDQDVRYHEILNLPPTGENTAGASDEKDELLRQVSDCGNLLKSNDFLDVAARHRLSNEISVPDEYILLRRVLGVYPVARLFVSRGVQRWHNEERNKFSIEAPKGWHTIRYLPEKSSDMPKARQIVEEAFRDDLGIPKYSPEAMTALLQIYAPIWEVQTQGAYDRIGAPFWTREGKLGIDTRQPVTFTGISYTRFEKKILTQLNYTIWFPSRPKEKALDIYGGFLDGVTFRITLDKSGSPLLYETMHNCGCYYKAYPTDRLHVREKIDYAEPPLILPSPEVDYLNQIVTIALESRSHYVRHLYPLPRHMQPGKVTYSLERYDTLRSLSYLGEQRKSMFRQDSIVPGSERLERLVLWPTGVYSPGAMRQLGRHAVAFVGRRHFDDPLFLDRMYIKASGK